LVGTTKVYSGLGSRHCYGIISLIYAAAGVLSETPWLHQLTSGLPVIHSVGFCQTELIVLTPV